MLPGPITKTPYEYVAAFVAGTLAGEDLVFAFNNKLIEREGDETVLTQFGASYLRDVPTGTLVRVSSAAIANGLPLWSANPAEHPAWGAIPGAQFRAKIQERENQTVRGMVDVLNTIADEAALHFNIGDAAQMDAAKPTSALDVQVGGDHYKNMEIQPIEFITRNKIGFVEGCVIKRLCRYASKNGAEDLRKARHEIDVLLELHYGEKP